MGFLTSTKLRIIKYKPYIKLDYLPTYSLDETTDVLERETNKSKGNDSVEGIAFSKERAVIMTGKFVDETEVLYQSVLVVLYSHHLNISD